MCYTCLNNVAPTPTNSNFHSLCSINGYFCNANKHNNKEGCFKDKDGNEVFNCALCKEIKDSKQFALNWGKYGCEAIEPKYLTDNYDRLHNNNDCLMTNCFGGTFKPKLFHICFDCSSTPYEDITERLKTDSNREWNTYCNSCDEFIGSYEGKWDGYSCKDKILCLDCIEDKSMLNVNLTIENRCGGCNNTLKVSEDTICDSCKTDLGFNMTCGECNGEVNLNSFTINAKNNLEDYGLNREQIIDIKKKNLCSCCFYNYIYRKYKIECCDNCEELYNQEDHEEEIYGNEYGNASERRQTFVQNSLCRDCFTNWSSCERCECDIPFDCRLDEDGDTNICLECWEDLQLEEPSMKFSDKNCFVCNGEKEEGEVICIECINKTLVGEDFIKRKMGIIMSLTPLMLYRNTIKGCEDNCECAICLEETEDRTIERSCKHKFHYVCNTKWNKSSIKYQDGSEDLWKSKCPLCRQ